MEIFPFGFFPAKAFGSSAQAELMLGLCRCLLRMRVQGRNVDPEEAAKSVLVEEGGGISDLLLSGESVSKSFQVM